MDIEFDRAKYLKEQENYLFYMQNKREIDELCEAKLTGKLMIEAPRKSGQSISMEPERTIVTPDSILDTECVYMRCAKLHSYDPDGHIRKVPYDILVREIQRIHHLIGKYIMDEVDDCYEIPVELKILLKHRQDKPILSKTYLNYKTILKYNIIHVYRYSTFICCTERGCPCRILIPSNGFYVEQTADTSNSHAKRPRISDAKVAGITTVLLPLEEEEFEVFQLSHDIHLHQKESKSPLQVANIMYSNGNKYDVHIDNQTEKYRQHIKYCDHCCRDISRKTYFFDKAFKILCYQPDFIACMDHTTYSAAEVADFFQGGKLNLLSAIEPFSRFLWSWVVVDQKTETVLAFIKKIKVDFPNIKALKTDNGSVFRSYLVHNLCKDLEIDQKFTFPYNPLSNGAVERSHASVKELLSKECRSEKAKQGRKLTFNELNPILQKCIAVLNNTKSSVTSRKPSELFRAAVSHDIVRKIYNRHISKNRSKFCNPEPVFVGSQNEIEQFENTYYIRYQNPESLAELQELKVLHEPEAAFLDSRHVLRGERVVRLNQYQLERHRRNKKPNLAIDCKIVAYNNDNFVLDLSNEKVFVLRDDRLLIFAKPFVHT